MLLISHVKEDRIKPPSSINTSQPCISDQCLPVCTIIHYYTLHYGLIILAMVYSVAPSGPFNVACTIIIQTIYLATTVYLALHSIIYIMPCCHDNHNTVIELAMQRRAAFSWAGQKAMRSLRLSSLRSRDALHLSSYNYIEGLISVRTLSRACARGRRATGARQAGDRRRRATGARQARQAGDRRAPHWRRAGMPFSATIRKRNADLNVRAHTRWMRSSHSPSLSPGRRCHFYHDSLGQPDTVRAPTVSDARHASDTARQRVPWCASRNP